MAVINTMLSVIASLINHQIVTTLSMKKTDLIVFVLLCLLSQMTLATQVYRVVDKNGRVSYSDQPSVGSHALDVSIKTPNRQLHRVKNVYDGDTIILENGDRVRLLGINTPEIEGRFRQDEPGGIAAKEWLQDQLKDGKVFLEYDKEKQDHYQRSLAHLHLPDGKHLNVGLVENGLAAVSIIPPNLRHSKTLVRAQQQAEKAGLGIWSMPQYQPHPLSQVAKNNKGWQRFIGAPKSIKTSRKYTRLIFNEQFNIRIANDNLALFPDLKTYLGKSIEIRGWVSRTKQKYSMHIQHPSALIKQ